MKYLGICLFIAIRISLCFPISCAAASDTNDFNTVNDYDYSQIDTTIKENSQYDINFEKLVQQIIGNKSQTVGYTSFIKQISVTLTANKDALIQILVIAILSSVLKIFMIGVEDKQISETSQMILSVALITILTAVFAGAIETVLDVLDVLIKFYKSLGVVLFPAIVMTGENLSAAAYYEIVIMLIGVINIVFKNILVKLAGVYMLLGIVDSITQDEHYTKGCELVASIIKYVCKTTLIVFLGLNGIKSMITPFLDLQKNNILYRTLSLIPGVGNTALTVSKTVIGAGTVVKNSIGVAAIIVIGIISFIPVLKLVVLTFLYKSVAAAVEPVACKSVVNSINHCSLAIANLLQIIIVTIALLIMTIGIICVATSLGAVS